MRTQLLKTVILPLITLWAAATAIAQQPHVYINPGHGGHESDDRNVVVYPFASGDTAGFWESNASLKKGFALQEVLRKKGYKTSISRVTNDANSDLALSTIVRLANNSGADVFYAIHSNATGAGENYRINYPLGLYRGYTGQPEIAGSDVLTSKLGVYLLANRSTVWTKEQYYIYGDWTFYPQWGDKVGLGVLRGNKVVSMLDEGSFHDYIPETYRLLSNDYCWVEGWNFSLGADDYFGRLDLYDLGLVTGNIRDDRLLREGSFVMHGDDVRLPINRATVRLIDFNGDEVAVTHTDSLYNGIYLFKYVEPGTYTVEVTEPEHLTATKQVTVERNKPTYCNFDIKRVRNTPPEVISYAPVWTDCNLPVPCNQPVILNFNWDMDKPATEAAFSIEPHVDGTFTWEDSNYRLVFRPDDAYDINTEYTVTLAASAQHGGGTPMEHDFTLRFTTQARNHLNTLALFPDNDSKVHFAKPTIEFRTDSLLNATNLFNLFHVYDDNGNALEFNKRSIKNNKTGDPYGYIAIPLLRDLEAGRSYRLVAEMAVSDTAGIHLPEPIDVQFDAINAADAIDGAQPLADGEATTPWTTDGNYTDAKLSTSTNRLAGSKALQCKYDFSSTADNGLLSLRYNRGDAPAITFTRGDTLIVQLWGDLSINTVEAVFTADESTPQAQQHHTADLNDANSITVDLGTVNYHGWRTLTAVVPNHAVGNYTFAGLQLRHTAGSRQGITGTILIDEISHLEGKPEGSAIADITLPGVKVGPVPASDYIVAGADGFINAVELLTLNGTTVARNGGNFINVADIAPGTYLLRVYVANIVSTHKVIVAH